MPDPFAILEIYKAYDHSKHCLYTLYQCLTIRSRPSSPISRDKIGFTTFRFMASRSVISSIAWFPSKYFSSFGHICLKSSSSSVWPMYSSHLDSKAFALWGETTTEGSKSDASMLSTPWSPTASALLRDWMLEEDRRCRECVFVLLLRDFRNGDTSC